MSERPKEEQAPERRSEQEILADMHRQCQDLLGNRPLEPCGGYSQIEVKKRPFFGKLLGRPKPPEPPGWEMTPTLDLKRRFPSDNFYFDGSGDIKLAKSEGQKTVARLQRYGLSRGISTYGVIGGQEHLGLSEYKAAQLVGQTVVPIESESIYRIYRWYLGSDWHGTSWLSGECIFTESAVLHSTLTELSAPPDAASPDQMLQELSRIIDTYGHGVNS